MPSYEPLLHPVLQVTSGRSLVGRRPIGFSLATDAGHPAAIAHLSYPSDADPCAVGDQVEIRLDSGGLLLTGTVCSSKVHGAVRLLGLADGYKKLCDASILAAYRKESAETVLCDILEAAGVSDAEIACPQVQLARFSTEKIPANECVRLLIKALEAHGHIGLRFFFDSSDKFHFGTSADMGRNRGEAYDFETGKDILRKGDGWVDVLPAPIRHTQAVTVDGVAMSTVRTHMEVSAANTRLRLWLEAI